MRKPPHIAEEQLRACLQDRYGLIPVMLDFLPVGLDYNAGVYRVVSEQGTTYLLKVTSRPLYEPRCLVPRYLNEQGIRSVVAPIPTRDGLLWAKVEEWTITAYPFIEGDTGWTGMTNEQWKETGTIFRQIHQVTLPPEGFTSLHRETFDPTGYTHWVRAFEAQHLHSQSARSEASQALRADWQMHQSTIHTIVTSLEELAEVLKLQTLPHVISHADLHVANLLRDQHGHVFVIDWDEVMLAPKERDFIFVREPYADAFFQGYGQREIDWTVLTYYLWERTVQDLIENARDACIREDRDEEIRADAAQLFHALWTEGSTIDAAFAAAAHLPENKGKA